RAFSHADSAVDAVEVPRSHACADSNAAVDGFGILDPGIVVDADPAVDRLQAAVHDGVFAHGYAAVQRRMAVAFAPGLHVDALVEVESMRRHDQSERHNAGDNGSCGASDLHVIDPSVQPCTRALKAFP